MVILVDSETTSYYHFYYFPGQGYVKVMMTLKSQSEENSKPADQKQKKRRSLYSEGFCPMEYRNAGVKKLIILAMSPTTETHENIETILTLLNIQVLDFAFSTDIKMILILLGKQGGSSTHACPFCEGAKPWPADPANPTTIGSLWENYNAFVRPVDEGGGGGNEKKGRDYQNVVRKPLITGDDETPILGGVFYFPELHCLIGIVGKIMKELETSLVFPSEKAGREYLVKWEKSANINRTAFHGTTNYTGI